MYSGEVNVYEDQISKLLELAETLGIKGLTEINNEHVVRLSSIKNSPTILTEINFRMELKIGSSRRRIKLHRYQRHHLMHLKSDRDLKPQNLNNHPRHPSTLKSPRSF